MVVLRLWCGKLKLLKPYLGLGLGLATQRGNRCFSSGGSLSHHRRYRLSKIITLLERDVTGGRKWTHHPITGQHRLSVSQDDAIESFDSLCNQGNSREALEVLDYLQNKGYLMDLNRVLGLAKLCSEPEALEEAKVVHEFIIALVSPYDVGSRNAIIEMYSGCGSVDDSVKMFDEMSEKNSETWCVMIKCFVNNGYGEKAMDLFTRFKEEGNKPDGDIFKEVFSACCSIEDVRQGLLQFEAMQRDYGIIPSMEHYENVTKILATCGLLDEAMSFVERMPMEPSVDVWETLMNLSRVHGDAELGDRCAEFIEKLDATRLDKVSSAGLVSTKALNIVKKESSYRSKPCPLEMDTIYNTLKCLQSQMMEMGYGFDTWQLASRNEAVEKANKERIFGYKEEVAIVKGLLSSRSRSCVTVLTNMRIFPDCHDALKLMSVITGRVLIKRDNKRYHYFKNGICGCNDYW